MTNKIIKKSVLLVILSLCFTLPLFSQNYFQPLLLDYFPDRDSLNEQPRNIPFESVSSEQFNRGYFLLEDFYPIGWSKNGLFAYISMMQSSARTGKGLNFIIVNTITDKVLYSEGFWTGEDGGEISSDMNTIWQSKGSDFSQKLLQFNIVQFGSNSPLIKAFDLSKPLPSSQCVDKNTHVKDKGHNLMFHKVRTEITWESCDDPAYPHIENYQVFLSYNDKEKRIGSIGHEPGARYATLAIAPRLAIFSPFEARMVVLVAEYNYGWEGTPMDLEYRLIGADLHYNLFDE
jgi:hypothetical protein